MQVVITGGAGFLGLRLARKLVSLGSLRTERGRAEPIDDLVLVDVHTPEAVPGDLVGRARFVDGDITDSTFLSSIFDDGDVSVFHLAAVVSSQGELEFDLAMKVNLDAVRGLLEALRRHQGEAKLIGTSSIAIFGPNAGNQAGDVTKADPQTTYGMTKAVLELLTNDYSRKGFLDGRIARLPTVIIRPGVPNGAASSAASAIFREALAGNDYVVPLGSTTRMAVAGVGSIIDGLVALHDIPSSALGLDRTVAFPSLSASIGEMIEAVKNGGSGRTLGDLTTAADPAIESIVNSWPSKVDGSRAIEIGIPDVWELNDIIQDYLLTDFPSSAAANLPNQLQGKLTAR